MINIIISLDLSNRYLNKSRKISKMSYLVKSYDIINLEDRNIHKFLIKFVVRSKLKMNKKMTIIGIILCAIGIAMYSYINLGIEIIIIIAGIITIICGIFKSKNNINEEEVTSNELNNDNDKSCHSDIKYKSYVSIRFSSSSKVYTYLSDPNHPLSTGERVNIMGNTGIEKVYVVKGDTLLPEKIDLKYKEIKVIEEEKSGDNFFDKYY